MTETLAETDVQAQINDFTQRAVQAAAIFTQYDQQRTDRIVRAVFAAGFDNRIPLAKLAREETGLGRWEDKVIKNTIAAQFVYNDIKDEKTVGVISEDHERGIVEIAQPMGPILGVIPSTNPTSTTLFKILLCMKTRNPIIISPSPKARTCCGETARICYEAALKAGAPEDCIQWVEGVSKEVTHGLMGNKDIALILATGGSGLVRAAYSSGTPTLGVGAGNVPVYIERSADVPFAVENILLSKTFDNGTICASEQAIVVESCLAESVKEEFTKRGAYILWPKEVEAVTAVVFDSEKGLMNANIVGQSAKFLAEQAGVDVPDNTTLLIAPLQKVDGEPLAHEILAPILAFYEVTDYQQALNLCIELNYQGGIGHTASIYSNDEAKILEFAEGMNAGRIVVNTPSSQGAVGGIFNRLHPSFTLGCGTGGHNITTDNITAKHLLNIQRIARRRDNLQLANFDMNLYLDETVNHEEIEKLFGRNM
ncbi:MAG: aldehyde dehydrogenase family protein [Phycisphaerae bacterium]|nr:aldehyde dehydrogenase family protein [Phycisphaerae bacterium]